MASIIFVYIAFSTVFSISAQLLLKRGMTAIGQNSGSGSLLMKIVTSPWVIVGMVLYGTGVIFWLLALSHGELSQIYPFSSLAYVGIVIGSYFLFHERVSLLRVIGIGIIICGLIAIGLS